VALIGHGHRATPGELGIARFLCALGVSVVKGALKFLEAVVIAKGIP
jgi:hypothetical protein